MANRQVYTIDINTSGLISGYKNAIKQMEQAGVSADVTKGLTSSLKKLEEQYERLSNEGKAGFTNSKDIENYQKRVERLLTSFRGFETQLGSVGGRIEKVSFKLKEVKKNLESAFVKLNFKNATSAMEQIASATDKEAKLTEIVNKELQERAKAVDELKQKYEAAAQAAAAANTNIANNRLSSNVTAKIDGKAVWTTGKNKPDESTRKAITAQADAIAKAAKDGEEAWRQFQEYLKNNGLDKAFNVKSVDLVRQRIVDLQAAYAAGAPEIEKERSAQEALNRAQESFNQIGRVTKDGTLVPLKGAMTELRGGVESLSRSQQNVGNVMKNSAANMSDLDAAQRATSASAQSVAGSADKVAASLNADASSARQAAEAAEKTASTFEQMRQRLLMFFSVTSLFNGLRNQIKQTFNDVKTLDKSFASIAMVTKYSVNEMWSQYSKYADMAADLGQKTNSVIQASALFYQQGLNTNEALELTTDTMKLATLAGNDFQTATQEMTSALRGFKMEMDEGGHVTDVYSELAAHAAASVDDIAQAMARTASIANSAGMSFENTSAFLTQMIETTQESAENIGTSLKTIIARFTELKENIAGTEDSEFEDLDYNKVDKALKTVGVSLKDTTGQFRDLDQVFLELSEKWDSLDRNTQRYVATIAAGSRQQSRFIAMMDNYDRTVELMDLATDAEGKADEQFAKYADTMEYRLNQLSTKWEEFRVNLLDSDTFKGAIDVVTELLNRLSGFKLDSAFDFTKVAIGAIAAFKLIKNNILMFLNNAKVFSASAQQLGKELAGQVSQGWKKAKNKVTDPIKIQADIKNFNQQLKAVETQILSLRQKYGNQTYDFIVNTHPKEILEMADNMDNLKNYTERTGLSEEQLTDILTRLKDEADAAGVSVEDLAQSMQDSEEESAQLSENIETSEQSLKNIESANQKFSTIMSTTFNAAATSIMGYASGMMTAKEAVFSFLGQMGLMIAQMSMQIAVEALLAKVKAARAAATTAAAGAEAAQTGASTAGAAANGALAVSEWAVLAPLLLIIAGFVALAAAIFLVIRHFKNLGKEETEEERRVRELAEAEEAAAEARKKMTEVKDNKSSLKKEVEDAEKLKSEYEDLIELQAQNKLTDEQEERLNEIKDQIATTMPEIVTYYDEETHQLEVQVDLWEQKLSLQQKLLEDQERAAGIASVTYYENEKDVTNKNRENELERIDETGINDTFTYDKKDLRQFLADSYAEIQKDAYADVNGAYTDFFEYLKNDDYINVDKLASYFTTDSLDNYTNEDYQKLLEKMVNDGDAGFAALNEAADKINEAADKEIEMYDNYITNERAAALAEITGVDQRVAKAVTDLDLTKNYDASSKISDFSNFVESSDKGNNDYDDDTLIDYSALTEDQKAIVAGMGYDRDSWNDIDISTKKAQENLKEAYEKAATEYYTQKFAEDILTHMSEATKTAIVDYQEAVASQNEKEVGNATQRLINSYNSDTGLSAEEREQLITEANAWEQEAIKVLNEKKAALRDTLTQSVFSDNLTKNTTGEIYLGGWSADQLDAFNASLTSVKDTFGEIAAADYRAQVLKAAQDFELDPDQINQLMTIDWSQMTIANKEEFKQSIIDTLEESGIQGGEKLFNKLQQYADTTGMIDLSINTDEALEEFNEAIDDTRDKVQSLGDDILSAIKDITESGEISFKSFESLSKSLSELGLSVYDYVDIDENGKIVATEENLNKLYKDQLEAQQLKLKQQLLENQAKEAELTLQLENLNNARRQIESGGEMTSVTIQERDATYEWALAMEAVADEYDRITGQATDRTTIRDRIQFKVTGDTDRTALLNSIDSQILATQTQLETVQGINETLQTEMENGARYAAAAQRDYNQRLAETKGTTLDVAEATKDYEKELDDLAKAQEDVAEKQKKLNETIEEYNELLYGSDNRKSSLDYLYNYDEAISSFNDEISRSKDLLADAKSIEESSTALQRYANATHNLIAEETAKQQVIQAGLKNYADMIENGSYAYTNRETGQTTNINFGDYARKDSRTGKYVIDQRLINESKFTDDIKDLLEEQVSNYNKYSDELLKSEDNVRKAEKELQDQRKAALKNYTAMETEIAEALKAQYQNEVDALKDKYEAMKDADDDYLDALQEAIDKQRQLRDQENAYEDLAKKEKQLSLMQRDTSGANELETRKLEEEIQDDRQNLLDQAIDNVIDGLSKLYESQQELRDSEMELKDALLENQLYWNSQAEQLAGSFQSADEYAAFLSSLSEDYAMMTLAQQQQKLQEYGETYTAASEYMAMQAMDAASSTGDFVVDTMTITGEEVNTIVAETAETFTTEVTRAYNETTAAFEEDMRKAEESIDSAKQALQEAIDKLNECSTAANAAAEALRAAQQTEYEQQNYTEEQPSEPSTLYGLINSYGVAHEALDDISHKKEGVDADKAMIGQIATMSSDRAEELANQSGLSKEEVIENWLTYHSNQASAYASKAGINGNAISDAGKKLSETDFIHWVATQLANRKFAKGGLVDFTGPAWVDGTSEQPEAFLSSEDTARIGEAAKILADIPWMDRDTNNASVVTNNGGDVSVEINLNIDHISSDTDIDEMIQRVKDEIVDVARPEGTNVILQQQLN